MDHRYLGKNTKNIIFGITYTEKETEYIHLTNISKKYFLLFKQMIELNFVLPIKFGEEK
jgi:hypothetical protein